MTNLSKQSLSIIKINEKIWIRNSLTFFAVLTYNFVVNNLFINHIFRSHTVYLYTSMCRVFCPFHNFAL